jgi:peroxiredoxin
MFGRSNYNYEKFSKNAFLKDMARSKFGNAPEAGDDAPDFTLRTLDGDKISLSDFQDDRNVVLTFGSATCPATAAAIGGLKDLYEEFGDRVQFLFVYVREAHPGEELPAHESMHDKMQAAELLRDEENLEIPILLDELNGKVHKKYGGMPNPTFLIDRSGSVAFRSLSSRYQGLRSAIRELLEIQEERDTDHAIVNDGEDASFPPLKTIFHAQRALERGGGSAIDNFREEMGLPGRIALTGGRLARPVVENPRTTVASVAAFAGVVGLGLWVGVQLRRKRFENTPYRIQSGRRVRPKGDDEYAVGI